MADSLPEPALQDLIAAQREYRIGPMDRIAVTVFGVPELERTGQVDASGNFSMPLIGSIFAAGETANSLAAKMEGAFSGRYLRDPQISITVTEVLSQQVTVDGSVARPGQFPVESRTTLLRSIAVAGGTTEFAQLAEVLIFRTVNGERMVARYSLKDIRGGRTIDPEVFGNDVIVVADDTRRRMFRDIIQSAPLLGVFYQITRGN